MSVKEVFIANLESCYNALTSGEKVESAEIGSIIANSSDLNECLDVIKEENDCIKNGIKNCDERIKMWQESKKQWKIRQEGLLSVLSEVLSRLKVNSSTDGKNKVSMTTRKVLEITEPEKLLQPYEHLVEALKQSLPPYIKVSLEIDKTALTSHVKSDDSLLVDMPESLHWKESKTVRLN